MAEGTELVAYQYNGDTRSLQRATEVAIRLLDGFSKHSEKFTKFINAEYEVLNKTYEKNTKKIEENGKAAEKLGDKASNLGNVLGLLSKSSSKLNVSFNFLRDMTKGIGQAFQAIVGINFGQWLQQTASESIEYAENLNLFNVALGESVNQGIEFVSRMQEIYGMDPSNLMRYAGNFYQLSDAIDMPSEATANLSLGLTKAANDLASLFNVDIETVFNDLSSGMQGMSRAVRKYGMDIRTTTLQQTALSLGITEQVENMSEANRQGLRFITMMHQARNASGDFARTIEQPANQLRIFKEQMSQLGRAIGDLFVGKLAVAMQYINGFVMALRTAISFIGSLFGLFSTGSFEGVSEGAEEAAEGVAAIGESAGGAAKELKKFLAPFDELNVMQSKNTGGGGGGGSLNSDIMDPAIMEAIGGMSLKLEDVRMKANEVRDSILKFFGFKVDAGKIISWDADSFEANLIDKFPGWTATIQAVFDNWGRIVDGFKTVLLSIGTVLDTLVDKIKGLLGGLVTDDSASEAIDGLGGSLNKLGRGIESNADTIADVVLIITALVGAFKAISGVASLVNSLVTAFQALGASGGAVLSTLGSIVMWVGIIVGAIVLLYTNSESFASSFNSLMSAFVEGLIPILESIKTLFVTIWEGLKQLWFEHVQPMLKDTGDALAPVLGTIASLWKNCSVIISDFVKILQHAWTSVIQPIFAFICDVVGDVMNVFQILWENFLGPIIEQIGNSIQRLWTTYLKPIIDKIIQIVGDVISIVDVLWKKRLGPLVEFLANILAPAFRVCFQAIWSVVEFVMSMIFNVINTLLGMFAGVTQFLSGAFAGDWRKALSGLLNIYVSWGNGIIGVLENALNFCVSLLNTFIAAAVGGLKGVINGLGDLVEGLGEVLGQNWDIRVNWSVPQIPAVSVPRIPQAALATGGVVTSPTYALIGEGRYDEMVLPLGNSPQVQDLINRIAEAKTSVTGSDMVPVQVFLNGEVIFEDVVQRARSAMISTGMNPLLGG